MSLLTLCALTTSLADVPETRNFMGMTIGRAYYRDFYDGFDIYREIAGYQGDVLIVHGTEDSLVKPEHVQLYHGYVQDFLKRHLK